MHSSIFMPDASGSYPLGTYYDVAKLRNALHPVQLVSLDAWRSSLPDNRTDGSSSSLIIVAYSDFPVGCRTQLAARAAHDFLCPAACLSLSGVRRMIAVSTGRLPEIARLPHRCLLAAELREAVSSPRARAHALFRQAGTHASSVAILNWRRHDGGRPLLAAHVASALRARAIVPARGVVAAAHRLLRRERLQPHSYALVQLRSNHLAQAAHAATAEPLYTTCPRGDKYIRNVPTGSGRNILKVDDYCSEFRRITWSGVIFSLCASFFVLMYSTRRMVRLVQETSSTRLKPSKATVYNECGAKHD